MSEIKGIILFFKKSTIPFMLEQYVFIGPKQYLHF